ncbi:hypothetical protein [Nonomuraea sp. NPDC046570]|uniref:hypothetical protein n=1 Tax=Nonomuraea sp. NPDC046570 TaxID=3155255 RepID=UPI0033C40916
MGDQFDVIDTGTEGRRRWVGLLVLIVLLAVPVVGVLVSRDPQSVVPAQAVPGEVPPGAAALEPSDGAGQREASAEGGGEPGRPGVVRSSAPSGGPHVLHAQSVATGDDEVIDVVFPDGTEAQVRYPAVLQLDGMGSRPAVGIWVDGDRPLLRMLFAPFGGREEVARGRGPLRKLTPTVSLFARGPGQGGAGEDLLFAFGSWFMTMHDGRDGLLFEQRVALAKALNGDDSREGYLVLSAGKPVRLAVAGEHVRGEPVGPQLWFGTGRGDTLALVLNPGCRTETRTPGILARNPRPVRQHCMDGVQVFAAGDGPFVALAESAIRIRRK